MLLLVFIILGAALLIPAIVKLIKAGWVIWRILGIISCIIAIIVLIVLMYI